MLRHVLADPRFERIELLDDGHDGARLLLGITPLEVEGLLDARLGEHRRARSTSDVRGLAIEHRGCGADDLPRGMSEQVDRVFDAASAFERHRIDGDAQRLGELLRVERLGARGESDRALEQRPVHVVANETRAELAKRPLGERRLGRPKAIEHELPAEIDDGHLDRLGVGHPVVGLQQRRHGEQRWRHRCPPRTRVPIHRLELGLEGIIEELVPMRAQEAEQLARPDQALHQELLLSRVLGTGLPVHRSHSLASESEPIMRAVVRQFESHMITYDHVGSRRAPLGNLTGFPLDAN